MKSAFALLTEVLDWFLSRSKTEQKEEQLDKDQELADNIRHGRGQEVAEEWKRRKNYS